MNDSGRPQYATMIRDLPQGERPRERLRDLGPSYLSNADLIAILLRTGLEGESVLNLSLRLLSTFDELAGLARVSYTELCSLKGISDCQSLPVAGGVRARTLACVFTSGRQSRHPFSPGRLQSSWR